VPQFDIRRSLKDVLAGAMFIAFGVAFAFGALDYALGTPLNMGPGYMPLALGLVLAALGVLVIVEGLIVGSDEPLGGVPWRALLRGLGVAGALLGTAFLAALAREATSPLEALAIAVGLTLASVVIFVLALQLRLPLIGPWIPI
jgi:hypothetical protein